MNKKKQTQPTYAIGPSYFKATNFKQYKPPNMPVLELFYSVKFSKTFLTHWMDLPAYKLGILDENGQELKTKKDIKTKAEQEEYSPLNRISWLLKRMIQPIPGLKVQLMYKLWNLLVTKLMMHEEYMNEEHHLMNQRIFLWESVSDTPVLKPGYYQLTQDLLMGMGVQGDVIQIKKTIPSMGTILGQPTYAIQLDDQDRLIILSDGEYVQLSDNEIIQAKEYFKQKELMEENEAIANTAANIEVGEIANQILFKKPYKRKKAKGKQSFIEHCVRQI